MEIQAFPDQYPK